MSLNNKQLKIRLPDDLKKFIENEAHENASSQNSEVIRAIRVAMKTKTLGKVAAFPSDSSTHPHKGQVNEHAK